MDERTIEIYNAGVEAYSAHWEHAEGGVASLLPHIFSPQTDVLEIGFGSGRDLALLNRLGIEVYGIEASENFISVALDYHPELQGRLSRGVLPDEMPKTLPAPFDGILVSAMLMHIPDEELFQSAYVIRNLLKVEGRLVVSVPLERDDIKEGDLRDSSGRLLILRPVSRLQLLFERLGFEVTGRWESTDSLDRPGVRWATLVFVYRGSSVSESVDKIESIINRDRKTATYKLALLKALCDIAQLETSTVTWDRYGNVHVPIDSVVRKWIEYYWPIVSSPQFIPQTRGEHENYEKPIAFRKSLAELAELYDDLGGLPQFIFDSSRNGIDPSSLLVLKTAKRKIRNAIINGPVYYAGGGGSSDKPFDYNKEDKSIVFHADIWRELVLLGHWIGDSINIRWADLTSELSKGSLRLNEIIHLFVMKPEAERNVSVVRRLYDDKSDLECVWTGKRLNNNFDVDHAVPFALRHDNSLWNLFPVNPSANNRKRDKLPSQRLVEKNRDRMIYYWELLNEQLHDIFETDFMRFTGKPEMPADNWKNDLFWTFSEAVETTAARRGVERWEP